MSSIQRFERSCCEYWNNTTGHTNQSKHNQTSENTQYCHFMGQIFQIMLENMLSHSFLTNTNNIFMSQLHEASCGEGNCKGTV